MSQLQIGDRVQTGVYLIFTQEIAKKLSAIHVYIFGLIFWGLF